MIDTAEAAHQEVHSMLIRMREMAVQAANGTLSDADRTALNAEVTALETEITNIADNTAFAGVNLGTSTAVKFQTGTGNGDTIDHTFKDFDATTISADVDVLSTGSAGNAVSTLDAAISLISTRRGELGAISNRLSSTIANLDNIAVNLSSARGRIQDTDFAWLLKCEMRKHLQVRPAALRTHANCRYKIARLYIATSMDCRNLKRHKIIFERVLRVETQKDVQMKMSTLETNANNTKC